MSTTYRDASEELRPLVKELLNTEYQSLKNFGVSIELEFAEAAKDAEGEPKGPAIKSHGYPAIAIAKVNSEKDRVAGLADCRITVDADRWKELPSERQRTVLAHELEHFEVVLDKDGNAKTDSLFRPRLRVRKHDYQFGGFAAIAERYGEESVEVWTMHQLRDQFGQTLFPWAAEEAVA